MSERRSVPVRWLLCDYGNVLCLGQPAEDRRALAEAAGLDEAALAAAYWAGRDAYDRGEVTAGEFWARVCGRSPAPARLARLVELDVASWTHPNEPALAAVARARRAGVATAVLSNAPVELARAADRLSWLEGFSPRLFSCDRGEMKPSGAIYAWALERLGAAPGEVVFVDDRAANVEGARRSGMAAVHYREPAQLERLVGAAGPGGAGGAAGPGQS